MENFKSSKLFKILPGLLFIVGAFGVLFWDFIFDFKYMAGMLVGDYDFSLTYFTSKFIYYVFIAFGVFSLIKKQKLVTTIFLGAAAFLQFFDHIQSFGNLLQGGSFIYSFYTLSQFLFFLALAGATSLSLINFIKPGHSLLKLWFVPGAAAGASAVIYISFRFFNMFSLYSITFQYIFMSLVYTSFYVLIAGGLALIFMELARAEKTAQEAPSAVPFN